jgi:hypothetical protein
MNLTVVPSQVSGFPGTVSYAESDPTSTHTISVPTQFAAEAKIVAVSLQLMQLRQ